MAIPTSRAKEAAEIRVNPGRCNGCGLCVEICSDLSLKMDQKPANFGRSTILNTPHAKD